MKRVALIRMIADRATRVGVDWRLQMQGSKHEKWVCGSTPVLIPRHREINDLTAEGICRGLEEELGRGWWR